MFLKALKLLLKRIRVQLPSRSIPRKFQKFIKPVTEFQSHNSKNYLDNILILPAWKNLIENSYKFGGYKKFINVFYWSHNKLKYFDSKNQIFGGIPDIVNKSQICELINVCYSPNAIAGNDVSKYTFKVSDLKVGVETIEHAFSLNIGGAESFQHFMQDCLAIMAASRNFLKENPHVAILLPPPNSKFNSRDQLIHKLGIENRVIQSNFNDINIRKLYFWNFYPFAAKYSIPEEWFQLLHDYLSSGIVSELSDLVVITRDEKTRSFENENEIIDNFSLLASELSLNLVVIQSKSAEMQTYEKLLKNAAIIVAMHGGANFNSIFASKKSIFFEFVPTKNTNSTLHYVSKLGIRYVPVPLEFSLTESRKIHIRQEQLFQMNKLIKHLLKPN